MIGTLSQPMSHHFDTKAYLGTSEAANFFSAEQLATIRERICELDKWLLTGRDEWSDAIGYRNNTFVYMVRCSKDIDKYWWMHRFSHIEKLANVPRCTRSGLFVDYDETPIKDSEYIYGYRLNVVVSTWINEMKEFVDTLDEHYCYLTKCLACGEDFGDWFNGFNVPGLCDDCDELYADLDAIGGAAEISETMTQSLCEHFSSLDGRVRDSMTLKLVGNVEFEFKLIDKYATTERLCIQDNYVKIKTAQSSEPTETVEIDGSESETIITIESTATPLPSSEPELSK